MITLNTLSRPKGSAKNRKRIGRGQASGQGTQAGKGNKGQKARKSGNVRIGFEGGTMPLYMRLPKRGFSNKRFADAWVELTTAKVEKHMEAGLVNKEALLKAGVLRASDLTKNVKVILSGKVTKSFKFEGIEKFSKGALEAINKAGGSIK